jgi:hypothetical protein
VILEPNTMFEKRYTLLDARLGRTFRYGRMRLQPRLDVYNVLNSDAVNTLRTTYSATNNLWLQPLEVFGARMAKLGVQFDF